MDGPSISWGRKSEDSTMPTTPPPVPPPKNPHSTVANERARSYSQWNSWNWNYYPHTGYGLLLDPTMGPVNARDTIRDIVHSHYLDLHTRVVAVEFALYNAMVDRLCFVRIYGEQTKSGGLL